MISTAKLTTKGRITIPKTIRDIFGIKQGDKLHFGKPYARNRQVLIKVITPSNVIRRKTGNDQIKKNLELINRLAGSVKIPKHLRGKPIDEIMEEAQRNHFMCEYGKAV